MHEPSSSDPFWTRSKVIRIPRTYRQNGDTNSGRTRKSKLVLPVVYKAHFYASRHHWRYHICETGTKALGKVQASERQRLGEALNPTGILLCGLQGGDIVGTDYESALKHDDWCVECRDKLSSWLVIRAINKELGT